jgi:DNA gyrase subunit B/topoisomerase-4 subunit B
MASPGLATLTAVLGDAPGTALPLGSLRYQRVVLLMDPDADGIHAGALVQLFFLKCMPTLLEQGRIAIVYAPWGEIRRPGAPPLLSFHATEYQQQSRTFAFAPGIERIRYRGLGTITPSILDEHCVNPATRRTRLISLEDAKFAARVFGGASAS